MYERNPIGAADTAHPFTFLETLTNTLVRVAERGFSSDDVAVVVAAASLFPGTFSAVYDRHGVYHWLSPGYADVCGLKTTGLIGQSISDLFPAAWCRERLDLIRRSINERRPFATIEIFNGQRLEGTILPVFPTSGPALAVFVGRSGLVLSPLSRSNKSAETGRLLDPVFLIEADWGPLAGLTRREYEVLRLIAKGLENTEIAKEIHRTKRAVEWHIGNLYEALQCMQRTELFRIGMAAGLPEIDDLHWVAMMQNVHDGRDRDNATVTKAPTSAEYSRVSRRYPT